VQVYNPVPLPGELADHEEAAAGGDDGIADIFAEPVRHLLFQLPEIGFAVLLEDPADLHLGQRLDQVVGVQGKQPGLRRQCPGGTALAHPHEPDQNDIVRHVVFPALSKILNSTF